MEWPVPWIGSSPMSELRWNPILREWTITATHRQERTFLPAEEECPLCPHPAGSGIGELERDDFEIAVFENRFPSLERHPPEPSVEGTELTPVAASVGACEVVVYTPDHAASLADASLQHLRRLIAVWSHRSQVLGSRPEIQYVFVFENRGEAIGVTLHHPHGQIYGYPFMPPIIGREAESAAAHRRRGGGCLWCELRDQERDDGRRVIAAAGSWVAVVPFFARWPFEVHLLQERHLGWLHELTDEEVADLAIMLRTVLRAYDALFGFPMPYVMAVHQRPVDAGQHEGYHLHLEFYPPHRTATRLKYLAGSEAGAGTFINDTLPEESAALLHEAVAKGSPAGR
jgi:UDPglucose--hexose-1-phosphate uridylyltransferase